LAFWVSEPDQGQSAAINKGFARSTGAIMGWLNSDDILLPYALHHTAEAFIREPATMITTGFRKIIDADSRFRRNWFYWTPDSAILRHYCVVGQETTYWRRDVWEQIGPVDETLRFAMDYEYWQRMLAAGYHFKLIPHYLGAFREHAEGKTSAWKEVRLQELAIIYQQYQIAIDEADVLERQPELMGRNFKRKHRFWKDFLHQGISNHPRLLLLVFYLLNLPILSAVIVELHYLYACFLRGRCYRK
jgi:glycosyltransferase involved in cell wall biosynthesis